MSDPKPPPEPPDIWVVYLVPLPDAVRPAGRRVAKLLKRLGRWYGLRNLETRRATPAEAARLGPRVRPPK